MIGGADGHDLYIVAAQHRLKIVADIAVNSACGRPPAGRIEGTAGNYPDLGVRVAHERADVFSVHVPGPVDTAAYAVVNSRPPEAAIRRPARMRPVPR